MPTEKRAITFWAYRDPMGNPTCSVSTQASMTCRFLLFRGLGQQAVCGFGEQVDLRRGGEDYSGYIQPHDDCPLWKKEARNG